MNSNINQVPSESLKIPSTLSVFEVRLCNNATSGIELISCWEFSNFPKKLVHLRLFDLQKELNIVLRTKLSLQINGMSNFDLLHTAYFVTYNFSCFQVFHIIYFKIEGQVPTRI